MGLFWGFYGIALSRANSDKYGTYIYNHMIFPTFTPIKGMFQPHPQGSLSFFSTRDGDESRLS